jgi:hypothetical protein
MFRAFVQRHADLLRALPGWTLRVLFPNKGIAGAIANFESVARQELATLRPEMLAQLKSYFNQRQNTPNPRALSLEDDEFWRHQAAFDTPRFRTARIGRPSVVASASRRARFRSFKNGGIIADKMTTRLARS